MNILILGYQRSGTTILKLLLERHPYVRFVFHEKRVLTRNWKERLDEKRIGSNQTWGEKMAYTGGAKRGIKFTKNYIDNWVSNFRDNSRIVVTVRDPLHVVLSHRSLGWSSPPKCMEDQSRAIPAVMNHLDGKGRVFIFNHESLLINPFGTLKNIFNFCDLPSTGFGIRVNKDGLKHYKNQIINESGLYKYKDHNLDPTPLQGLKDYLNEKVPGDYNY